MSEYQLPAPWRCEVAAYPGGVMWLTLTGELDFNVAAELEQALTGAMSRAWLVVVDLQQLEFMDTAGLHLLSEAQAAARENGTTLVIAQPSRPVRRLLTVARGLHRPAVQNGS